MDPEVKQRFDVLESAMVRLAEGQVQTNTAVRELALAQKRTEQALERLTDRVDTLGARVDRLAELMIRGYTESAERHATVIERLGKLEGH